MYTQVQEEKEGWGWEGAIFQEDKIAGEKAQTRYVWETVNNRVWLKKQPDASHPGLINFPLDNFEQY